MSSHLNKLYQPLFVNMNSFRYFSIYEFTRYVPSYSMHRSRQQPTLAQRIMSETMFDKKFENSQVRLDLVKGAPECVICLEVFKEADQLTRLCCLHSFHTNCLKSWTCKYSSTCPVCRSRL